MAAEIIDFTKMDDEVFLLAIKTNKFEGFTSTLVPGKTYTRQELSILLVEFLIDRKHGGNA